MAHVMCCWMPHLGGRSQQVAAPLHEYRFHVNTFMFVAPAELVAIQRGHLGCARGSGTHSQT